MAADNHVPHRIIKGLGVEDCGSPSIYRNRLRFLEEHVFVIKTVTISYPLCFVEIFPIDNFWSPFPPFRISNDHLPIFPYYIFVYRSDSIDYYLKLLLNALTLLSSISTIFSGPPILPFSWYSLCKASMQTSRQNANCWTRCEYFRYLLLRGLLYSFVICHFFDKTIC